MKSIIYYGVPAYGHVNPSLPLIKELIGRGYHVFYYTSDEFKEKVIAAGAEYRPYPVKASSTLTMVTEALTIRHHLWRAASMSLAVTNLILEDLVAEAEAINPVLIIHDGIIAIGKFVAQKLSKIVPTVCFHAIIPMTHLTKASGRLYFKYFIKPLFLDTPAFFGYLKNFFRIKRKFAFQDLGIADLFFNKENLNLLAFSQKLHPDQQLDSSYFSIGPTALLNKADSEKVNFSMPKRPFIYASLGTVARDEAFISAILEQLGNSPFDVILVRGQNEIRQKIADNIQVYDFVEQSLILPFASVALTTGGMNTLNEAIRNRVPLVIYPFLGEQKINADMIEKNRLGIKLKNLQQLRKVIETAQNYQLPSETITKQITEIHLTEAVNLLIDYIQRKQS